MDRLYIPVIILHLSIVAKKIYCNDHTITEFGIIDSNGSSTSYVIIYELIDVILGLEQEGGSLANLNIVCFRMLGRAALSPT